MVANGKIYAIPFDSSSVLIIDPQANTVDTTTITGLSGTSKWQSGVLSPDGKIYSIPRDSQSVLIIDPAANFTDTTTISGLPSVVKKWAGGVLALNGRIYGIPADIDTVLIIAPMANGVFDSSVILSPYFNGL